MIVRVAAVWAFAISAAMSATMSAFAVHSPETAQSERTEVRLIADHHAAAPGSTVILALEQKLQPGWHSYWINPGDSGLETTVAWTAPADIRPGPIEWPTPQRLPFGPLTNFGFADHAVLRMPLQIPTNWPVGAPLRLHASANWLVCRDICVPEQADFTLQLPIEATPRIDQPMSERITKAASMAPTPLPDRGRLDIDGSAIRLQFQAPIAGTGPIKDVFFFPINHEAIVSSAPQRFERIPGGVKVEAQLGDTPPIDGVSGVLTLTTAGAKPITMSYRVSAIPGAVSSLTVLTVSETTVTDLGLGMGGSVATAAILAFLGGLILNVMPCVFPVLALKAFTFANQSDQSSTERITDGLAYGGGILVSFLVFAGALIILQGAGEAVGWGFQLQTPWVVAALSVILFIVGLNLSGFFAITISFSGGKTGSTLTAKHGAVGAFFTGVLAALVASPCTAPFMGAALGFALTQPPIGTVTIFTALALGFAAPIVALSASPALGKLLPRPGPWMIRLREVLAFPMYLAAAWLLWVLGGQKGIDAMVAGLAGFILIAFAIWAGRAAQDAMVSRMGRLAASLAAFIGIVGAGGVFFAATVESQRGVVSEPYTAARLAALRADGRPVFVNMTADWCVSCKVNEKLVLAGSTFAASMAQQNAVYLIGDWTSPNPEISAFLRDHKAQSIPLYIYYPAGDAAPRQLPPILSVGAIRSALDDT